MQFNVIIFKYSLLSICFIYFIFFNSSNLCREVMLESVLNVPLILEGNDDSASIKFRSNDNEEVLIYQMTLIPKEKFHLNHIKMEPHCIVKDKKCMSMDYMPILSVKIDLDESSNDQNRFHSPSLKPSDSYIQTSKTVYLNNYLPELTVPINVQPRDLSDQVLIVIYYQPNHPTVNVSINIDNKNKGSIQAAYCPSLSGCRAIVTFDSTGESFNNQDPRQITFQLTQNNKDIWIDYLLLAPAIQVTGENLQKFLPIDLTNDFISKCASEHFNIEFGKSDFCDKSAISMSAKYNRGAQPCDCDKDGSVQNSECSVFGGQCTCKENVIGRQCSKCKSGYFGFPNCQKCDCPSGNCDEETGKIK
jgi:laminin, alpha 3/5